MKMLASETAKALENSKQCGVYQPFSGSSAGSSGAAPRAWSSEIHPDYATDVCTTKRLRTCKADKLFSLDATRSMAGGPMNPPVVRSGLRVYEVRSPEDHRNVGFRCAAVWSAVVTKVIRAIGYARHQSRSRDALIREDSMRYKNFVVLTALALPVLAHLSAVAQTCPDNVPHITGTWTVLPYQMPINPISANLLPNGKVLIVAGSENDARNNSRGAESYRGAVWDPRGSDESSISVQNLTYDVLCSGTAALFDGRSLIVGGTAEGNPARGENRASIFNPVTNQYMQCQNMVDGRWYATATALADGRIMAMSGITPINRNSR